MTPTAEQQQRAAAVGGWLVAEVPRLFHFDQHRDGEGRLPHDFASLLDHPRLGDGTVAAAVAELEARFGRDYLTDGALDFLLWHQWPDPTRHDERHYPAVIVAREWVVAHPSDTVVARVTERARAAMTAQWRPEMGGVIHLQQCMYLLRHLISLPTARESYRAMLAGEWGDAAAYQEYKESLRGHLQPVWPVLAEAGLVDEAFFNRAMALVADAFPHGLTDQPRPTDPAKALLFDVADRYQWRLMNDLSAAGALERQRQYFSGAYGTKWLLLACRHFEAAGLKKLSENDFSDAAQVMRSLAYIAGYDPGESASAVAELKTFAPATLWAMLPHSRRGRPLLLSALGAEGLAPLVALVDGIRSREFEDYERDIPNCGNPESGVVDAIAIRAAVDAAGEKLAKQYLKLLRAADVSCDNTTKMVEAVCGWNTDNILKSVEKETQIAIKAYGVLPISRGSDEVLERYQRLREIARTARQYGADRRTNTLAAVEAGLTNLAATAGYPDRTRLEWAMEALLSATMAAAPAQLAIEDWTVALEAGPPPRVVVRKDGRELKSVPAALKKHPQFLELKGRVDDLKNQASRIRASLEDMMIRGDTLSPEQLRQVSQLLSAGPLITSLVLMRANRFGLYDATADRLIGLDRQAWPIDGDIAIAHVTHLIDAGVLEAWQREIVQREIDQPFKQVFRELYRPTAAELTESVSLRFAGHAISTHVADRVFRSRRWEDAGIDFVIPFKRFPAANLRAYFDLPEGIRAFGEVRDTTTGAVSFTRVITAPRPFERDEEPCLIADVPPILFSEVMRDADLVVSVAALDRARVWSSEAALRRADAARAVMGAFGIANVTFDGSFANVAGTLRNYRIHLGSGSVHLEPGGHVCTVPQSALARQAGVFLPVPVDDEWRTAEIIGVILLFANDHKIKDPDLLAQIDGKM